MKTIYTIGFTQKSAMTFFETLKSKDIQLLIDTRINNVSQLAGFAKAEDLKYFLDKICSIKYDYRPDFAPTKELLKDWRDKKITWEQYEIQYNFLLAQRDRYKQFLNDYSEYERVCVLCSEATPEHCHRRLLTELLKKTFADEVEVVHL